MTSLNIEEKERQQKIEENKTKFEKLIKLDVDGQAEFFLKSFIFELGENWKDVNKLAEAFKAELKDSGKSAMDHVKVASFLQKNGLTRTGLERKRECKDIDLNSDGTISFVEYLLLHYKSMVLQAYYKRMKTEPEEDLSKGGVGVVGVGSKLLDELMEIPLNLDPDLVAALEDLSKAKKARMKKIAKLEAKAAKGGVMGKAAQNELEQFLAKGDSRLQKIEITLKAARKKNLKSAKTAVKALKEEQDKAAKAKKDAVKAKRNAFAARAAMFEQSK